MLARAYRMRPVTRYHASRTAPFTCAEVDGSRCSYISQSL